MEPHELNRMFDRLAPTPEQEEEGLRRLLEPERKVTPMKKLKKLTVLGIAAALMIVTCAAAVVTNRELRLVEHFGVEPESRELIAPIIEEVNVGHTYQNGWTVQISEVLADRWSIAVLADVIAPENTVLGWGSYFMMSLSQLDAQGERLGGQGPMTGHVTQLEDGDPDDNRITVLCQFRRVLQEDNVPFTGSSVKVIPLKVYRRDNGEELAQFKSELWGYTVELPDIDPGITYPIDQTISIGENQVTLSSIYLSPLGLTVHLKEEPDKLLKEEGGSIELNWEGNVFLNTGNGTQIDPVGTQDRVIRIDGQDKYVANCSFRFDQILRPEEIVSVTLFGQTFELK